MRPALVAVLLNAHWQPTKLGSASALNAWWDPLQGVTASGGLVSAWMDKIAGYSVTQASGTLKPAYSATAMNGLAGVVPDGVDDNLALVGVPSALATGGASGWIATIASQDALPADTTGRNIVDYGAAGATRRTTGQRFVNAGTNRALASDGVTSAIDANVDFSGIHVTIGSFTSAGVTERVDGVADTSASGTINTSTTRLRIGATAGTSATQFWQGAIGDILIGSGALSLADEQRLEAFLLWKYGKQANLPSTHPYRFRRP